MAKIDKFREGWDKLVGLSQLVKTLEEPKDANHFDITYRDFLGFLQTEFPGVALEALPADRGNQLAFAKQRASNYQRDTLAYSLRNTKDILSGLEEKLNIIALSVVPIKDFKVTEQYDLEKLISSYENELTLTRNKLQEIDKNQHPEAYQTQEKLVREHQELTSLLKDHKDLVKNTIAFKQLRAYAGAEDGEPKPEEMQKLCIKYLVGILEKFKDDKEKYKDNASIVMDIITCLNDPKFLSKYYQQSVLMPAEKKFEEVAKKYDLKEYIERNMKIADTDKQIKFFNGLYSVSKKAEEEEKLGKMYKELYGFAEKVPKKLAA